MSRIRVTLIDGGSGRRTGGRGPEHPGPAAGRRRRAWWRRRWRTAARRPADLAEEPAVAEAGQAGWSGRPRRTRRPRFQQPVQLANNEAVQKETQDDRPPESGRQEALRRLRTPGVTRRAAAAPPATRRGQDPGRPGSAGPGPDATAIAAGRSLAAPVGRQRWPVRQ